MEIVTGLEGTASSCVRGQVKHQENFFHCEHGQELGQAGQGGGGVAVPGSIKKMTRHST